MDGAVGEGFRAYGPGCNELRSELGEGFTSPWRESVDRIGGRAFDRINPCGAIQSCTIDVRSGL